MVEVSDGLALSRIWSAGVVQVKGWVRMFQPQGDGAWADVVLRAFLGTAGSNQEHRLGSAQGPCTSSFLIHAQDDLVLRSAMYRPTVTLVSCIRMAPVSTQLAHQFRLPILEVWPTRGRARCANDGKTPNRPHARRVT